MRDDKFWEGLNPLFFPLELISPKCDLELLLAKTMSLINQYKIKFNGRLMSLDAFRGMTIASMILVNNPGSWDHTYHQLRHSDWNGCTFTDLIFPFFLFIAGVSMWFSFKKYSSHKRQDLWKKILKRSVLIFAIGLFISWFPFYDKTIENLRFIGVLQRIAVSFIIASVVCVLFSRKWIAIIAALILLGYWWLVVASGIYDPFTKDEVFSRGIDFVSYLSTPASAVPIMIGYLVGSVVDRPKNSVAQILKLFGTGIILVFAGVLWSIKFPIIKSLLWSSSYVIYTTGFGIIVFSLCLLLIENTRLRNWFFPFMIFGLNPLFLYALSILLDKLTWMIKIKDHETFISLHEWIHRILLEPWAGNYLGSLLYAIIFVGIHWIIAEWLFKKDVYIKV